MSESHLKRLIGRSGRLMGRSGKMRRRSAVIVAASFAALLAFAAPAVAGPLAASPQSLSMSTPVGTTTTATLTFTNTGDQGVELTGAFLTYKPFLSPGAPHGQVNALAFFSYDCGLGVLGPGESCSYTVVFQPGVLDDPDPEPGTVFRGRIVQDTNQGPEVVRFTATAT
jgi:hypothetical protein